MLTILNPKHINNVKLSTRLLFCIGSQVICLIADVLSKRVKYLEI